jgi:hypothetical protein
MQLMRGTSLNTVLHTFQKIKTGKRNASYKFFNFLKENLIENLIFKICRSNCPI